MKTTEELKLIPYANNARTHSKEQIQKIRSGLREFGFVNPVLIDKEKGDTGTGNLSHLLQIKSWREYPP